jgi:glycosyltransferase involved in cell wall biosynthesis
MACGLPALLSHIPVLKEVGQASALYFDLANPTDLVTRVAEICRQEHDLATMSQKGYQFALEHARKDTYMNKLKSLYTV